VWGDRWWWRKWVRESCTVRRQRLWEQEVIVVEKFVSVHRMLRKASLRQWHLGKDLKRNKGLSHIWHLQVEVIVKSKGPEVREAKSFQWTWRSMWPEQNRQEEEMRSNRSYGPCRPWHSCRLVLVHIQQEAAKSTKHTEGLSRTCPCWHLNLRFPSL
jgi:hypothetical protein